VVGQRVIGRSVYVDLEIEMQMCEWGCGGLSMCKVHGLGAVGEA
jgi:hypothetical protein